MGGRSVRLDWSSRPEGGAGCRIHRCLRGRGIKLVDSGSWCGGSSKRDGGHSHRPRSVGCKPGVTPWARSPKWIDVERTSEDQGRLRPDAVHSSLPVAAGVHVLGWGGAPSEGVVQGPAGAAIDALTRGCDLVVVDLPRQLGEVAAAAICRCDFIVLVTPRTSVAVAAASRLLGASELDGPCIELVTRGKPWRTVGPGCW